MTDCERLSWVDVFLETLDLAPKPDVGEPRWTELVGTIRRRRDVLEGWDPRQIAQACAAILHHGNIDVAGLLAGQLDATISHDGHERTRLHRIADLGQKRMELLSALVQLHTVLAIEELRKSALMALAVTDDPDADPDGEEG